MAEIHTTRTDWLLHVAGRKPGDIIRIHPKGGLTTRAVIDALSAQKVLYSRPGEPAWRILDHGTAMLLQRR